MWANPCPPCWPFNERVWQDQAPGALDIDGPTSQATAMAYPPAWQLPWSLQHQHDNNGWHQHHQHDGDDSGNGSSTPTTPVNKHWQPHPPAQQRQPIPARCWWCHHPSVTTTAASPALPALTMTPPPAPPWRWQLWQPHHYHTLTTMTANNHTATASGINSIACIGCIIYE